ncbi:MAG: HAD family hydrolase [Bulleidia sp.]
MKTYIFDYNGTILDDAQISVDCENVMLQERGLPYGYTLQDYRSMYDNDMVAYYRRLGYTFENETFADVADEFTRLYMERFEQCGLCEGVLELLESIRNNHDQCVILSSCHDGLLHEQCDLLGISGYFIEIMGIDNYLGGSKVDIGRHWMIRSGVRPEDCVYFGDTLADLYTAQAIGVEKMYSVSSGHQSYQRLVQANRNTLKSLKEYIL